MVEKVTFLKSNFFKNVSSGGAQAHAIKECPKNHILLCRLNDKNTKLWGYVTPEIFLKSIEKNHNLFEIITCYPHKVYFDVDFPQVDNFKQFVQDSKTKLNEYFPNAIFAISGSNEGKASIHIILQNYMIFNEQQRNQIKQIAIKCGFDSAVYTKNRLMKCVNQSKTDGRIQAIIENDDLKHHCITNFLSESLTFHLTEEIKEVIAIEASSQFNFSTLPHIPLKTNIEYLDENVEQLLTLLPCNTSYHHEYTHLIARFCYYNGVDFERFYLWRSQKNPLPEAEPREGTETVGFCRMKWQGHWHNLHKFPPVSIDRIKKLLETIYPQFKGDKYYSQFCNSFDLNATKIETIHQGLFPTGDEPQCSIFNTGMGSGKTAQTIDYSKDKKFIFITPNRALTNNIEQRFKDKGIEVTNYMNVKDKRDLKGEKLLCSIHSLHYVRDSYDFVIIDEIETVLCAFWGDFLEQGKKMLKKTIWGFFKQFLQAKHVILLDAFITTKTTSLLDQLGVKYTIYERLYEPATRTIQFRENQETMIDDIQKKIKQGSKVLIFYPIKNQYPTLCEMFKEAKGIKCYNADVDDSIKNELKDVNTNWKDSQVVMFNNVITCGINYDNDHLTTVFDYMYIFVASFNNPRDVAQVTYRARNLTSNIIQCCFLPNLRPNTFLKDLDRMSCPIYAKLYHDINIEKCVPQKNCLKKFFLEAPYKMTMNENVIEDALHKHIKKQLTDNKFYYEYGSVDEINSTKSNIIQDKIFEQCATMLEKVQLQKYFYQKQFINLEDVLVEHAWNEKLFFFLKRVHYLMFNHQCLFRKIADFNGFELFPKDITKVKLNDEILDDIFKQFSFKYLTRESSHKKILKEIYNAFFGIEVVKSQYIKKHTIYYINLIITFYEDLYKHNLCIDEMVYALPIIEVGETIYDDDDLI